MSIHKEYALIAILATATVVGVIPAFAAMESLPPTQRSGVTYDVNSLLSITVATDKPVYDHQSTIMVSGHVKDPYPGQQVTITIYNPIGNLVEINQLAVDANNNFADNINTASPLWNQDGVYTIHVQYGDSQGKTNQAQFTISSGGATSCDSSQISATLGNQLYCIPYTISGATVQGGMLVTASKSLVVNISADNDGQIVLDIPTSVLNVAQGDSFFVLIDGQEMDHFTQTSNGTANTLTIPFMTGNEKIEIIGTQIVPEFGPIAALVLAIAIISIIAVSAKTGLRFMPKY